ncbi:MAG: patatin-like phospholipase family protein [Acidobacteriota bacterium]
MAPAADDLGRPKIGLALGGGGAKGGAHLGVLKVLEELDIPVDYIAGTSIGAIMGGLYASGMTADQLRDAVEHIDWVEALQDKPPRRDRTFRRKEDDLRYLIDLELGIGKGGLKWPAGLVSGQNLFFLLQALSLPVAQINNFDRLPIPFRAVATNIEDGSMVVLRSGNLASAMRASMAIPGFFAPVELDGVLLVDGGMVNNLPVDVVRAMGADIVIAVDLGKDLESRDIHRSLTQVLQQTMRMLTRPNVAPRLADADLVIAPDVARFGTMGFNSMEQIVEIGYETADAMRDQLAVYSADPEYYAKLRSSQLPPSERSVKIDFIDYEGNHRVDDRVVAHQIRLDEGSEMGLQMVGADFRRILGTQTKRQAKESRENLGGEEVDLSTLSADMRRLYGLGDFELVDFTFEDRDDETGLVIHMREKPWGPNYLHFGLELATDLDGETRLGFLVNMTKTRINPRGAEWRNELLIGTDSGILSEFYQPLDFAGKFFVAPRINYRNSRPKLWIDNVQVAELGVDILEGGFDLGYQWNIFGEVRVGVTRGNADVRVETGTIPIAGEPEFNPSSIDTGGLRLLARADRLDSTVIPRRGGASNLSIFRSLESLGAESTYTKVEFSGSRFLTRGRNTGFVAGRVGWSPGDNLPAYDAFALGGFGSLSGFADNQLLGQSVGVGRLGYYRRMFGTWYLGGWAEAGNVWQSVDDASFDSLIWTGTAILAKDSSVGPIYVAYGWAEGGFSKLYFILGRAFL